jgi:hypothetical protein
MVHKSLDVANPGEVIVVDAGSSTLRRRLLTTGPPEGGGFFLARRPIARTKNPPSSQEDTRFLLLDFEEGRERRSGSKSRFRRDVHHRGTVHHRRRSSEGLAAAPLAGIAAGLFLALYLVFVGTPLGRALDASVVRSDLEGPPGDVVDRLVAAVNPLTVTLAVAILIWLAIRSGRPVDGIRAGALVAASALLAGELEALLAGVNLLGTEAARELGPSFYPSGHAAVVMSLCLAALWSRQVAVCSR